MYYFGVADGIKKEKVEAEFYYDSKGRKKKKKSLAIMRYCKKCDYTTYRTVTLKNHMKVEPQYFNHVMFIVD